MSAKHMSASRDELSICAQVSLRYERLYLLPWIAYHTLLGFDRIYLYIDDSDHLGPVDPDEQARMLHLLSLPKHMTVYSMAKLNMSGPTSQLQHCIWTARKHSVWMGMWDIDEVPAMGLPPAAMPEELRAPPNLKMLLRSLPNRTAGLLVSRLEFDCGGRENPLKPPQLEYEEFTRRRCHTAGGSKVLWRGDSRGTGAGVRPDTFHTLSSHHRSSLREADGSVVRDWSRCCDNSTDWGWWRGAVGTALAPNGSLTSAAAELRLHHFITRSAVECRRKARDQDRPGAHSWGHAWRVGRDSQELCACPSQMQCSPESDHHDLSVAQYGPAIRREVQRLFGAHA